ncbi:uncharacterized protein LOC132748402 [Ruditapes philippinarum]|uniref:uncharacterized protein LOC132748402 n=1 Tax=Ruditapes philippinarum TaxID=129788 RepID=UPI00295AB6F2|nr:uncharacterized protein LOC132748402 [Ruditapes philippinarum]
MDTHGLGKKAETNRSTEYDNRVNIHDSGQELIVTEGYIQLELLSQESPYSYAKESDVSNGTVSSYVDGRVGVLNSHDSNKTVDQDANTDYNHTSTETVASNKRAENHTCTKTVDQNARAENHTSTGNVTRNKRAENYNRTGTVDRNALAEKHTRSGTVDRNALAEKHTRSGTVDRNAHAENKTRAGTVDRNAHAENKTRTGPVDRNAHAENKTRAGTVDRNAHTESHIRLKTVDRDVREINKVIRERDVRTEERTASCLVPIVSYHLQSGSQQVSLGQDPVNLSDSTRSSSTTYDKILDSNVITHVQNSRNSTSTKKNDICSPQRCIIATIFVLIILIAAGVIIYFVFVKDDPPNPCERLPEVKHAVFKSHASGQAEVTCDRGFVLNGSSTITCQNDVWSKLPSCKPIVCGPYPQIDNGVVNGSGKSFGFKANIICNPGFYVVDSVTTVACFADGNWTPASECREHPCGNYTLLDDMVTNDELMYTTTTLCLQCKAGLEFVQNSDRCVTCQNGRWQGSPECEIPGTIDFDPVEPIYNVSDPVSLRCVVHNSSEWQSTTF